MSDQSKPASVEEIEEAYAKGREHNDVCIAQPLREELQHLREQLESKDGYSIGYQTAKADYSAKIQQAEADTKRLVESLKEAIEVIHMFHGDEAWPEYQHSPEMKRFRAAIDKAMK